MREDELKFREKIDGDRGLKSKRRILTISSLILLAMNFSGARIVEANSLFLKISFSKQEGLQLFLITAVIFLLVRYYNYAEQYHAELFKTWSSRMLNEPYFIHYCHYSDHVSGLIVDVQPKGADVGNPHKDKTDFSTFKYRCRFLFRRHLEYFWCNGHSEGEESVSLLKKAGFKKYLRTLLYELKYQAGSFFNHREQLDILAPYMLGVASISSYLFKDEVHYFVELMLRATSS